MFQSQEDVGNQSVIVCTPDGSNATPVSADSDLRHSDSSAVCGSSVFASSTEDPVETWRAEQSPTRSSAQGNCSAKSLAALQRR